MDDLHDARAMLEDGNFRTLVHFQSTVVERVDGNSGVTVNAAVM